MDDEYCVCGHTAEEHEGICTVDDCMCHDFELDPDYDDEGF
jgi:hypothetical protein